jgi:hypothetical protein
MKNKIFLFCGLLTLLIMVVGCSENKVTGHTILDLTTDTIKDGETTIIKTSGKNTGNIAADVILRIISEDSEKLIVDYPGILEFTLQPGEDTGTKIVKVTGYTDYSSTKYWIKTQLVNKADNSILDEKVEWITVKK